MMRNFVLLMILMFALHANAQSILNATSPEEFRYLKDNRLTVNAEGDTLSTERVPLPYGYVEEKDIIWSQVIWEVIDLNQKLNQPYFYSSNGLTSNARSLYEAILEGVRKKEIPEIYADEYFKDKMNLDDALSAMSITRKSQWCLDEEAEGRKVSKEECYDTYEIRPEDIRVIKIKGMWYIDSRQGEMKYRILGIAPMGPDLEYLSSDAKAAVDKAALLGGGGEGGGLFGDEGPEETAGATNEQLDEKIANISVEEGPTEELLDLFWIFYPSARKTLVNYDVFNPKNLANAVSFDDLLNARRFHSIIYKIEDGYDRTVAEYYPQDAMQQMEFTREFRDKILSKENVMWNY